LRQKETPVTDKLADIRYDIALANRMLANEGVLDAFGHVSARHPDDPGRYLLSRSRSPELIEPDDLIEYTLDSKPVAEPNTQMYAERVIHGEIYKARPDVMAVCHHHGSAILPFCITLEPYVPVTHLGAAAGQVVPFWDQREEFGDTNLLVVKPEEGVSLARALGDNVMVLMVNHGATVVGPDLKQLVFRSIYSCRNAECQSEAKRLGATVRPLSPGEIDKAKSLNAMPNVVARTWEYWSMRLSKAGELPPTGRPAKKAAGKAKAAAGKRPKTKVKGRSKR
jgi:ribulose-5-phosphate 4-epimerase/fuculose-1-phosphate aldolase